MNGHIILLASVWCGYPECGAFEDLDCETKTDGAKVCRVIGWHKTRKYGWLCPECYKRYKED